MQALIEILVLRHAEEPAQEGYPDLTDAGERRAERLARYIPKAFGTPNLLIAAAPNRTSVRPYLTLRPLSKSIGAPIFSGLKSEQYGRLARRLLGVTFPERRLAVICWTHKDLPALADALRARPGEYPDPWDEHLFDLILHFKYRRSGLPVVTTVRQPF